jgi:hypothetical protein
VHFQKYYFIENKFKDLTYMRLAVSKVRLKNIVKYPEDLAIFDLTVKRTNEINTTCSHFIRSYLLYRKHNNLHISHLNQEFIDAAFSVLILKTVGRNRSNGIEYATSMNSFWTDFFSNITEKFNASNISFIILESSKEMHTCYVNNIQMRYPMYVRQFVNTLFAHLLEPEELKKGTSNKDEIKAKKEKICSNLTKIKDDIFKGTFTCDEEYHEFINIWRPKIVPANLKDEIDIFHELNHNPYVFIECMMNMNSEIEKLNIEIEKFNTLYKNAKNIKQKRLKKMFQPICFSQFV